MNQKNSNSEKLWVGKFGKTHGVQGWVRVYSEFEIENIHPWFFKTKLGFEEVEVEGTKWHGKILLAKIKNHNSPEEAKLLTNKKVYIYRDKLPTKKQGEYFWSDLIGLKVFNQNDIELGVVENLIETGANDVLVVKGKEKTLIPFVMKRFIKKVDLEKKIIFVDWE